METWLIITTTLCISFFLKLLFSLFFSKSNLKSKKLPPGPSTFQMIISTIRWPDIELLLKNLKEYGPLINLKIGSTSSLFIASHSLAYQVLVQQGSIFSDRPKSVQAHLTINSSRINVNTSPYGPLWRLLRRNLSSVILHPARIKSYSKARSRVLSVLIQQLNNACLDSANDVKLINYTHNAIFWLLVVMCFGDNADQTQVEQIKDIQSRWMLSNAKFIGSSFLPIKIFFQNQRRKLIQLQEEQERIFIPLIEARIKAENDVLNQDEEEEMVAYVDTLLNLELPEEKRKLKHEEIVSLCSEFLGAGIDTTATSLQWIMANLVKNPSIQEKLYLEIFEVMNRRKPKGGEKNTMTVTEDDVEKMPYLKAVILEGLRRHPPGHFLQMHMAAEEVELNGYVVPKHSRINFMVGEMGLDPEVWENPLEFKPERFLSVGGGDTEAFDITGSREIKMIPFGAGRRICPGYSLAMLHLEYFVANLIWHFEWKVVDGDEVDLSEKQEFTVVMKNPLRACIHPRVNQVE